MVMDIAARGGDEWLTTTMARDHCLEPSIPAAAITPVDSPAVGSVERGAGRPTRWLRGPESCWP
jgi:hypothetical protein